MIFTPEGRASGVKDVFGELRSTEGAERPSGKIMIAIQEQEHKEMTETERKIKAKIPGEDTGIYVKNSFCDICSPMPGCGTACYVKDNRIIKVEGIKGHPSGGGVLCTKGLAARQYIYREDRVLTPLRRTGEKGEGKFEPITWDEAFSEITDRLNRIKKEYGASSVMFFSGYNKWYRPFLQRLAYSFGSVNYGSESSTCFHATAMSHKLSVGYDALNPDRKNSGTFLGWGYAPYYSRNMGPAPAGGRKGRAKVIIVDPRITPALKLEGDLHLRLRPGTDGALAHAIARELIVNDMVDHEYIRDHVYGYEQYKEYVMRFTPEKAEEITGVPADKIKEAARIIGGNRPLSINQSASVLVHHKNGLQNHRAVHALLALTGSFDVPGGMVPNPDTFSHVRSGFGSYVEEFEKEKYPKDQPLPVGAEKYPLWAEVVGEAQACDLSRQILEGTPYPVKAVYAHGMNMRMFGADRKMEEALKKLDFLVDTELFLTDTAKYADIVLPCCTSFERSELRLFPGCNAQYTEPVIPALGQSRPDHEIICELARRLNVDDDLLKEGPDACYGYVFRNVSLDLDALKKDRQHVHRIEDAKTVHTGENPFLTPTGKFELWSTVIEKHEGLDPLPVYYDGLDDAEENKFDMILNTGGRLPNALHSRLHDVPWLRSLRPDPMADISFEDAERLGIIAGSYIRISTTEGSIRVRANLTSAVPEGTVFMYQGYREADVNSIIPYGHNDPYSGYPGFRSTRCSVTKEVQ